MNDKTCVTCGGELPSFPAHHFDNGTVTGPYCDACAPAIGAHYTGRIPDSLTTRIHVAPFTTKDSGKRRNWETGSQRDDATGKGRYDLLPREAIHRLAQLYERGAAKYDDRNWEKGQPLSVVLNSMLRHAFQAAAGLEDEDHLSAVAWNAFAAITILERISTGALPAELDDRPHREAA